MVVERLKLALSYRLKGVITPNPSNEDGKDPVSKLLCSLEIRTMGEVQKSNIFPSSPCVYARFSIHVSEFIILNLIFRNYFILISSFLMTRPAKLSHQRLRG
jgi:hypothetical protein